MMAWYWLLTKMTRAYVCDAGFEPIINLLLERYASAMLGQTLSKRWWDTTHPFHIANRELTVTHYDFHCMTGLKFYGAIINLEGE